MTPLAQFRKNYAFVTLLCIRIKHHVGLHRKQDAWQAEYERLAELPDYLLKDTGIKRSDINLKLNKPFWWS